MVDAKRLSKKEDDGLDEEEEVGATHKAWSFPFFLNPPDSDKSVACEGGWNFLERQGRTHGKTRQALKKEKMNIEEEKSQFLSML